MATHQLLGIHHVTAIAGDPSTNARFYTGVLGLRLVKRTVNFDDPETYHLYYGDEAGQPTGALIIEIRGDRIQTMYGVANPEKLRRLPSPEALG